MFYTVFKPDPMNPKFGDTDTPFLRREVFRMDEDFDQVFWAGSPKQRHFTRNSVWHDILHRDTLPVLCLYVSCISALNTKTIRKFSEMFGVVLV